MCDPTTTTTSHTPENTNANPSHREVSSIDLTDQTSAPADNLWGGYLGSLADVREPVVNLAPTGHQVRWNSTGIFRNSDQAWNELWRQYPDAEGMMIFTMNRLVNGLSKNGFDELYHEEEHLRGPDAKTVQR